MDECAYTSKLFAPLQCSDFITTIYTMHPFRAYISMFSEIDDKDWEVVESCLSYKMIPTNRIILKPGQICDTLYFLENGSIRYFAWKNKEYQTTHILQPPFIFTSSHSFSKQIPSEEGIQAVEESYVWTISRKDAYRLLEVPSWKNFISQL